VVAMSRGEKVFVIFYFAYMLAYIPFFVFAPYAYFPVLLAFHFFGMVIGVVLYIVIFRDIYKRDFSNPNTKVTWTLLMLLLWPSIFVYLYKYGFRPRQQPQLQPSTT
jgi:hypothetical protein